MDTFALRYQTWQGQRALHLSERERLGELQRPMRADDCVPPALAATVKVGVLRSFYLNGKPTEPGDVVEVPEYLARDLVAIGKATRV